MAGPADFEKVFDTEIRRLAERRKASGGAEIRLPETGSAGPTVEHGLLGLALSGGGIRSATFNLGLLQALGRTDALKRFDYLSTVSGGGYVGSCLTSLLTDPAEGPDKDRFPLRYDGREERDVVRHLRHHRTYLTPRLGLFSADTWRLASSYLGGLAVSLSTFLSLLGLLAAVGILLYPEVFGALGSLLGSSELEGHDVWGHPDDHMGLLFTPFWLCVVGWITCFAFHLFGNVRLLGSAGRRVVGTFQGLFLGCAAAAFVGAVLPFVFPPLGELLATDAVAEGTLWTLLGGSALTLLRPGGLAAAARTLPERLRRMLLRAGAWIFVVLLCFLVLFVVWLARDEAEEMSVLCFVVVGALALATGANDFSMFWFYRDRLGDAYLVTRRDGRLRGNDRLRLSRAVSAAGPLHLLNATVNLPGSEELDLRGRRADLFVLSPFYSGSEITGYRETAGWEPSLTLADAMAISGAAANPQFGPATNRALGFLMGLLNVRLGAWVENPRFARARFLRWPIVRQIARFWPWYLVKELLGLVDVKSRLVNLSDGGHIENLGVYELLRRRCKLVVASDAGADPERGFSDLGNLVRMARIDLGVRIEIDVATLRPDPQTGLSEARVLRGTIFYPVGEGRTETGTFVYVKSSLVAADAPDLHAYRRQNPRFPHEPTTDQFFDEAQFESYRELGYRAGKEAVELIRAGRPSRPPA